MEGVSGLYVALLSFAAKIAGHKQKHEEAARLLAFIIDACAYSGAFLNQTIAAERMDALSLYHDSEPVWPPSYLGNASTTAKIFAQTALLDLGLCCTKQDPDLQLCISIITFLDKRRSRTK